MIDCLFVCVFVRVFVCLFVCLIVCLFAGLSAYVVGFRSAPQDASVAVMSVRDIASAMSQVHRNRASDCATQRASKA